MPPLPFIDVEASGFGGASYPIEVGCVLADGSSYCSLVIPESDWRHWDASAESVHGIARDLLFQHGRSASEVAGALNDRLRGQTVYTDSWYHDFAWLSRLYDAAETRQQFTLQDLRTVLDEERLGRWSDIKQAVTSELNLTRHRASHDARILQSTLMRLAGL
jgi:hypothetical protein